MPLAKIGVSISDQPAYCGLQNREVAGSQNCFVDAQRESGGRSGIGFARAVATRGFSPSERSLYSRWQWAAENGWTREKNGKAIKLKRVSETTLKGRYESGLNAFWKFAIEHWFAYGPAPNFESVSKYNPPAAERDAFKPDELYKFFASPPSTGCHGVARRWSPGSAFVQDYFYWAELIEVLCGMRPSEIAQLRCRDILDLYGKLHFRYAPLSIEQQEKDRFDPQTGGTRGKSPSAFRWVTIHWFIVRLGIVERRTP